MGHTWKSLVWPPGVIPEMDWSRCVPKPDGPEVIGEDVPSSPALTVLGNICGVELECWMGSPHVDGANATDASEAGEVDATRLGDIVLLNPKRKSPCGLLALDEA